MDDVAGVGDALMRQLADVDQALEPIADTDERAEVDELGDRAVDDVADVEVRDRGVPRIRLQATDREADPTSFVVDVDDLGLDLLTDLIAGVGIVDLVPRELALVDQPVDTPEVDEYAERCDRANRPGDLLTDLQTAEQFVPLLAPLLVQGDLLGEDETVRLAVDLEDLQPELAADERHELLGDLLGGIPRLVVLRAAREVHDLTDRNEAANAAVDDEAALVVVDDRRLDDDARLELLLHGAPLALQAGPAERQDDVPLGRLRLEHVDEDRVADIEGSLALTTATEQLAVADDTLALGPDVDQDLILVDPDDLTLDDVAVLEALDVRVLLGEQLLHRRRLRPEGAGGNGLLVLIAGGGRMRGLFRAEDGFGLGARFRVGFLRHGLRRRFGLRSDLDLRLRGGGGFVCGGGGLVGDGNRRDGIFGRLVGDGGGGLRLRRGPARLLFGQGVGHSWWWIRARESGTARATLKPGPKRSGGPWCSTPRSAPSCVE